jgi:HAD superfamily hydrolase (TIGR01509 family)
LRAAQAVIFDVEGTLLDCVPATLQSWQEVLRAFGHEVSRSQLQELSGRDTDELLAELLPQVPEATRTRIGKEQGRHYRACYLDNVGAIPGVAKVLAELRQAGKRIALGTSCERDELDHYLAVAGCGDLVDYIACGDDARRGKPHPDLFALALRRLGVAARAAVVVGDTLRRASSRSRRASGDWRADRRLLCKRPAMGRMRRCRGGGYGSRGFR